ncbi:MAG: tryptophan--tRNA ligase [Candidatus Diapherotrites archaeon]|nr:tryptophan--tRNA ligase [Candidatus Diapherotrites archaeon]
MAKRIDAWGSEAITNYEHVFKEFGLKKFPEAIAKELKHRFFERGIVIAHRDFEKVSNCIKTKKPFINMTGIAASGTYHLGHKVDIDLFKFFKDNGAKNLFAVCDLDAYCSREKVQTLDAAKKIAVSNIADALALGLEEQDIYLQSKKPARYYTLAFEVSKKITSATNKAIYGEIDLGKVGANILQYADILHGQLPEFYGKMPSVTGIGLDQDPHARATRDIAKRLPYSLETPSFIYFKHESGLMEGSKMSSSNPDTAIFLNDSPKEVERKIKKAFTGGRNTLEEHRKLGGVLKVDKVYEMLLFHYPNSKELAKIADEFSIGKMLSREMKEIAIEFFQGFLKEHQRKAKEAMPIAQKIVFS